MIGKDRSDIAIEIDRRLSCTLPGGRVHQEKDQYAEQLSSLRHLCWHSSQELSGTLYPVLASCRNADLGRVVLPLLRNDES